MEKRAAQEAETHRRLVDATLALHAERGILATKPADVAARANVALTTYYKHFSSREELVRACTSRGRELIPPPDVAAVAALPATGRAPEAVRTLFDYYEAREPWLFVGRTEERLVPEVQPVMERLRALRDGFLRAAFPGARTDSDIVAVGTALLDFWAWRILRREVGLSQEEAIRAVTEALHAALHRPGPQRRSTLRRSST
jgi:AcrR family transcriptional regulator